MSSCLRRSAAAVATAGPLARAFSTSQARSVARITIVGGLASAPELRTSNSGREVVNFALGTESGSRENRKTDWYRISSFAEGKLRDMLLNLPKGTMMYVSGDCSLNTIVDSEGRNRPILSIFSRQIEVLRRPQPKDNPEGGSAPEG